MSYNSNVPATELLAALTAGLDFTIPELDLSGDEYKFPGDNTTALYQTIVPITVGTVTDGSICGEGVFDKFMASMTAHLRKEFEAGRITGAEYSRVYISQVQAAMSGAIQFVLSKDASFWQAQSAQLQAITARIALETTKVQAAQIKISALTEKASYALTMAKLATEDATFSNTQYQRDELLPAQKSLVDEQKEAQRAQTLDVRTDALPVAGTVGKQKDLHSQQIESYKRDSEVKVGKLFVDAWITQKTIDEGVLPPDGFTNTSLDGVLTHLKANTGLD